MRITLTRISLFHKPIKAVRMAIQKQEEMGIPIVRYDPKGKCLYIINEDGSRTIVKENIKRYSDSIKERNKGDD